MKKILTLCLLCIIYAPIFSQKKDLTLEEIWSEYKFYPKYLSPIKSSIDGEHYTTLKKTKEGQEIHKFKFINNKKIKTLFKSNNFDISRIYNYSFSNDERKILIATKTEKIYRYSSKSIFYIYNIYTDKLYKVSDDKLMHATFSPDGEKIAYVKENNLFIYDINNQKVTQITTDGKENNIINGSSDWVYEEEFGLVRSYEWSPDSKNIAYYKFNEQNVPDFSMDIFRGNLYPKQKKFKYPKAGEENSIVKVYIYNLELQKNKFIYTEKDYEYIPRIKWTNSTEKLILYGMNRYQNELDFIVVNSNDGSNSILFTEKDNYYIDVHDNLTFLPDNKFIWTSEKDGYNHIYLKDLNGLNIQLTKGNWEVTDFHGINSDIMKLYYTSTQDGSINRSLFVLDLELDKTTKLSKNIGNNNSIFSKGMKYYINSFSQANTPEKFTLHNANGDEIDVLNDNEELQKIMAEYNLSEKEIFTIQTKNAELNTWMIKPPNFDENKKYPLYMFVYGGPGSQEVKNSFDYDYFWHQMLAQKGYIVACVDNRGTGGKGAEFKKLTYKELGKYETIDQIDAAKYFRDLSYVDSERIGIQGWSYGGYMSSLAITKGADVFKLAVAIAPVTNWRFYDNIYTERYMRTPSENSSGYDENSPINYVENLKGHYLLIHGGADDNVHVQNSMEMISALVAANKQFDLFIYPDKNHGIYGNNTRLHLYQKITDFILNNL